ncbi:MAG: molybdate ABC transporter substrate-binding protein [Nitrospina sp.]|mgnify:CR=1 FL=1|jgi:molybdate transport system substrate-binding protein|nr:molybdate ABC transporter substrate-binding protein [Nitrospina sp.]MBT3508885.1 molybdate ABC transporter substrate-binding protein [Nitrospina sp.]MBT3876907.1 molybdate ABC transporter substrate-binding protein [Nitrospina sp.]MBT4047965.1 molybdate ABC transporter substrate-binding protein [Nitrospina sp.]MBT4558873.1 molybdate ABC transporter substrate-binding protein [Nitrospina sp.]
MRNTKWLGAGMLVFLLGGPALGWSEEVHVAVASNFLNPLKEIAASYKQDTGNTLVLISGSTGKLYAQARNGAPFDVLLAADARRPTLLEQGGVGVAGTRFTYAEGSLVLWSLDPKKIIGVESLSATMRKLAIANPKTAPYGRAAHETLQQLDLWEKLEPQLVRGESIAQTLQFVATGNAEMGFIAKSQMQDPRFSLKGSQWEVPSSLHKPISQQAILLKTGLNNIAANQFLKYLKGPASIKIIKSYGYRFLEDE